MLHKVPESKICSICKNNLPAASFSQDASRVDGLKFCCKECSKTYKPTKSKRNFDYISKVCELCKRDLPAKSFAYSQHASDRLSSECRTCKMIRRGRELSTEDIIAFEEKMQQIYVTAFSEICRHHNIVEEIDIETILDKHRSEFENIVYKKMDEDNLLATWKTPVWIHKSSLPMDK